MGKDKRTITLNLYEHMLVDFAIQGAIHSLLNKLDTEIDLKYREKLEKELATLRNIRARWFK